MPPVNGVDGEALKKQVRKWIDDDPNPVVFSKTTCPFCRKTKELFKSLGAKATVYELDQMDNGPEIQAVLLELSGQKTVPNVFVRGKHIGGNDAVQKLHAEGQLTPMLGLDKVDAAASGDQESEDQTTYDFDLVVIGGGSGGLAASKQAAKLGARVAVCDFVVPTPMGTTWGLGGTCVNVGCIPKKLMHYASLNGEALTETAEFGWNIQKDGITHDWNRMIQNIQDYIHSLNFKYKVQLKDAKVEYINGFAKFVEPHKLSVKLKNGKEREITTKHAVIAVGGRPKYPDIPGDREYCITSDDMFSLPYAPGKTLVVGASYVALECAGFLTGLGYDTTVMVRSIFLRGFDQDMAEQIAKYMEEHKKTKMIRGAVPVKVEEIEPRTESKAGLLRVTSKLNDGSEITEEYNTVLLAIGRTACTAEIGLDKIGVEVNKSNAKLKTSGERTNVPWVYAIGDVLDGKPELTPVAIQAGSWLANRLYGGSSLKFDYKMIPTTVFTPLEYGAIGYSEEDALKEFGEENIEIYHTKFQPLEWVLPHHPDDVCYGKLIILKPQNERVIGFHYLGPNAGEVTQGYAVGMKMGATKKDFDNATGIHPTTSEIFTTLTTSKSSGGDISGGGC